jgi:hypothetical protein
LSVSARPRSVTAISCERLERLTVITHREFDNVKLQKLEDALYGVP